MFAFILLFVTTAFAKVRVVATVPDLAAIAQEVGGAEVEVVSMSLGTQDPHFVDAKPNLAIELSKADLLLAVGRELEVGWLPNLQTGARNPKILPGGPGFLDCSRFVYVLEAPSGPVDRSMGDIHPSGNPHYLYDPRTAVPIAQGIAAKLGELDPAHRDAYSANATRLITQLGTAITNWEGKLVGLKGRPVLGYHRSWAYLANWVGFQVVDHIEPKPGVPPSPTHVANIIGLALSQKVTMILQETWFADSTSQIVASKTGAKVVKIDGGTLFHTGQTLIQHYQKTVDALLAGAR